MCQGLLVLLFGKFSLRNDSLELLLKLNLVSEGLAQITLALCQAFLHLVDKLSLLAQGCAGKDLRARSLLSMALFNIEQLLFGTADLDLFILDCYVRLKKLLLLQRQLL